MRAQTAPLSLPLRSQTPPGLSCTPSNEGYEGDVRSTARHSQNQIIRFGTHRFRKSIMIVTLPIDGMYSDACKTRKTENHMKFDVNEK